MQSLEEEVQNESNTNIPPNSELFNEKKKTRVTQMRAKMDLHLEKFGPQFQELLVQDKSEDYIQLFSKVIEEATMEFAKENNITHFQSKGRSNLCLKYRNQNNSNKYNHTTQNLELAKGHDQRTMRQYRRLVHINSCTAARAKIISTDTVRSTRLAHEIRASMLSFLNESHKADNNEKFTQHLKESLDSLQPNFFKTKLAAERLLRKHDSLAKFNTKHTNNIKIEKLEQAKGHKQISKIL